MKNTVSILAFLLTCVLLSSGASTPVADMGNAKEKRYTAFQRDVREYKRLQREQDQRELASPQEKAMTESLGEPSNSQEKLVVPD